MIAGASGHNVGHAAFVGERVLRGCLGSRLPFFPLDWFALFVVAVLRETKGEGERDSHWVEVSRP